MKQHAPYLSRSPDQPTISLCKPSHAPASASSPPPTRRAAAAAPPAAQQRTMRRREMPRRGMPRRASAPGASSSLKLHGEVVRLRPQPEPRPPQRMRPPESLQTTVQTRETTIWHARMYADRHATEIASHHPTTACSRLMERRLCVAHGRGYGTRSDRYCSGPCSVRGVGALTSRRLEIGLGRHHLAEKPLKPSRQPIWRLATRQTRRASRAPSGEL